MGTAVRSGTPAKHDALVEIIRDGERSTDTGAAITIDSPVAPLFGAYQRAAVEAGLTGQPVRAIRVSVHDNHALDFVLRARVKAAMRKLVLMEGMP